MAQKRGWQHYLIPPGVIVIAGALVVWVKLMPMPEKPEPANDVTPVNVNVQEVQPLPQLVDALTLSAVIEPEQVVRVAAEVAGRVEAHGERQRDAEWRGAQLPAGEPIDEGEPIQKGDPILHLNRDLLQAQYDRAKAQYEYDETEYARIADLYERGASTKTEYDDARNRRDTSLATYDEARFSLERTTIQAPISGILNQWLIELGEYAVPGQQVAELVDIGQVKIAVDVPEKDVHYLHVGDAAEIVVGLDAQQVFEGNITYVSELADDQSRTSRLEITVDNSDHQLRSGQIVRVRLTRQILHDVVMVPLGAIIPLEVGRVAYVVDEDGNAARREVELGLIKGRDVEICKGLEAGDRLIVAGHRYVGPGQPVTIIEEVDSRP